MRPEFPSTCFAGRIVFRGPGGLNWSDPCGIPAENELPTDPPMYFCSPHFGPMVEVLHSIYVDRGMTVPGVMGGVDEPSDLEDLLKARGSEEDQ